MTSKKKLAIVCTHPIQYYIPVFQQLSTESHLMVFYSRKCYNNNRYDPGFKRKIKWDIPMLKNYSYTITGKDILAQLESFDPDKILIYGWPFHQHLKVIRRFKGKIWFRGDSIMYPEKNVFKKAFKSLLLNWIYKHVEKAFYVGSKNRQYFQHYGLKDQQLIFAPHAVDNKRFDRRGCNTSNPIRKQLKIPEADVLILFAGKFNSNKNPFLLLEAFRNLNLSQTHLLFVGDGDLNKKLKKEKENVPNVHILPFHNQTEMPMVYQACDIFCLTSTRETWGLSVNEAMAAGKAILISDSAGAAADLVSEDNGRIFKCNDPTDLQKKLHELAVDKARLIQYGQCSQSIIQNWDIKHQITALLKEL